MGIEKNKDKIKVNEFYQTNIDGVYAIGDIVQGQALAHVASAEGITCVEKMAGHNPQPIDYNNIPGCTYTTPEVASVGMTEKQAKDAGYEIKVGKFTLDYFLKIHNDGLNEIERLKNKNHFPDRKKIFFFAKYFF